MAKPRFVYTTAAKDPVIETTAVTAGAAAGDFVMRDTSTGGVKLWAPAASVYICGILNAADTAAAGITKASAAGGTAGTGMNSLTGGVQSDLQGPGVMGAKGPTGNYQTGNAGHYTPVRVGDVYEIDLKSESADYVPGIKLYLYPGTTGSQAGQSAAGNSEPTSGILLKLVKSNNGQVGRGYIQFTAVEGA